MHKNLTMVFTVKVNEDQKYYWLIEIISCMQPFKSLRPREKEVLAAILKVSVETKNLPKEQQQLIVFHHLTKERIAKEVGISLDNLYNVILSLRKKNILNDSGIADKYYKVLTQETNEITFKFSSND